MILVIQKNLDDITKLQIRELFKNVKVDNYKYIVVATLYYFYYRKPRAQAYYLLNTMLIAGFFKKKPKEAESSEFEVYAISS